jgi:hypothetical protein
VYIIEGRGKFSPQFKASIDAHHLILWGEGDEIVVKTNESPVRFLLIAGNPIKEPIAWGGPIVMNTQEELRTAFEEYNNGTFLHHKQNQITEE